MDCQYREGEEFVKHMWVLFTSERIISPPIFQFFSKNALILFQVYCVFEVWVNLEQGKFWFKINSSVRALEEQVETISF